VTVPGPLVLAYHGVGDLERRHDPDGLVLPVAKLRAHVDLLRRRGYRFVKQAELARALGEGEADGLCSLTFDDGTQDNLDVLRPLLAELDVPATVFACPGLLGEPYPFTEPEAGVRFMTREELVELAADPRVEIGSHTREHVDLGDAGAEEALEEMTASRADLQAILGGEVVSFAYPNCSYSTACPEAARRAGYTSAVTCGAQGSLDPFELRRVSPNPIEGRLVFEMRVRGVYHRVRESMPIRVARAVARPVRFRS
jgi:peptidoglycan/xylan/chitin deacetylase (PgdA/CDA1 family)